MKKILVFALALMLAIPALAFADGNDADITAQGTVVVTAAPDMVISPVPSTYARSAMESAIWAFCSTSRMVVPA